MTWEIVIGLEIHTQLSTQSKIFSGASTAFGAEPNTQACAVDIALPGVLPVLNKGAVERAIKFGLAVGAQIASRSVFARKNYFYPDLPKGYQISQFDQPVVGQGALTIQVEPLSGNEKPYEKVVRITRAHLEEDAGKSLHEVFRDFSGKGLTGVDLNRAGTPLLEIVSEPDMRSAAEAVAYAKATHSLVRWIDICDGNMQEGSFRCDANVSVRRMGEEKLGTRREIKNLNSFKFLQQAIEYEAQWQIDTLESGGKIQQATVLFDADKIETRAMRSKEDAHDYRYFPDPDLLPLEILPQWIEEIRRGMHESRESMRKRFIEEYHFEPYMANSLVADRDRAVYFDSFWKHYIPMVVGKEDSAVSGANWAMIEIGAMLNLSGLSITQTPITPEAFAVLVARIVDGTISHKIAKEVFGYMWAGEGSADAIIEAKGLKQVSDVGALEKIIDEVIAANPAQLAEYRAGKEKVFGFFVGLSMKASKGKANPTQLNDILKRKLAP